MLNILLIEKNEQTKNILQNYLKEIEDVEVYGLFNSFEDINIDFKKIDLIIFDIESAQSDIVLPKVQKLKEKYKNLHFIATSYEIDSELVSKTLKYGVRDFVLKPVIQGIFEVSIKKIKDIKNNIPFNLSKAISVFSVKGGVGKSSFAINLAYELSNITEEKVCLVDLSMGSGDIATYLNLKPKFNTNYIISKFESSDKELLLSLINNYENKNLYVLSDNVSNIKLNPQEVQKVISSLKNIFPYVIIDTPATVDETTLSILNASELVLMLALPNLVSLRNCQTCIELFNEMGYSSKRVKLLINRYTENSDITSKQIEQTLKKEIFYKIPNNYLTLSDAINQGHAVAKLNPQSNIARAYKNIANEVLNTDFMGLDENNTTRFNHGIFNLLRRMGE